MSKNHLVFFMLDIELLKTLPQMNHMLQNESLNILIFYNFYDISQLFYNFSIH